MNHDDIWPTLNKTRELQVDSEVTGGTAADHLDQGGAVNEIGVKVLMGSQRNGVLCDGSAKTSVSSCSSPTTVAFIPV